MVVNRSQAAVLSHHKRDEIEPTSGKTMANKDDDNNDSGNKKDQPRPLVARISLWTRTTNGRGSGKSRSGDSGNDSGDDGSDDEVDVESDDNAQLEQRLKQANLPDHVKRVVQKEMQKLRRTPSFMSDYVVTRSYLELIAELPWNEQTIEMIDLQKCRRDLDNDHYGMNKLKERVLQYLAVRKLRHSQIGQQQQQQQQPYRRSAQPILMFVGPPGTGKTSIAQSIANSLGRKFQRISLGGVSDQSSIRGHRRTYIGSMPGRIIQGIKDAGVNNPVILLDEVDKMGAGPQCDPSGALLEVLDPEQNHTFTDHYLNVAFDLSRVMFIATANSSLEIPSALLDRMEVIQVPGYTQEEKFNIARRHLVPKQVIENGLRPNSSIVFHDDALRKIISSYSCEAGVRTLERRIGTICRAVAVRIVEGQQQQQSSLGGGASGDAQEVSLPVVIDAASLETYLGPAIYERESNARVDMPGVAVGLAWTSVGGVTTLVEAEIMKGKKDGGLVLTGQLGSVMRESAMLALNWVRANFHLYEALPQTLGRDLVENTVHIHFPAGAVGKDGPSAGVTIVTALISMCADMSVEPDLAMTGEITLRGVVLKVGGVKSKVSAAHRAGIKRVILPMRNEPDLNDVPASIKDGMKFHFVSTIEEVLMIAFDNKLLPKGNRKALNIEPSKALTSKL